MNLTILPKFMLKGGNPSQASTTKTIGLLDIFGFERFKHNFFEQLLINYTNEKLHKLYISAVFDAEKMELSNEGLGHCLKNLKYPDNTGVEVIKLLDEKQRIGQADTKNGICTVTDDFSKSQPRPNFDAKPHLVRRGWKWIKYSQYAYIHQPNYFDNCMIASTLCSSALLYQNSSLFLSTL